VSAEKQSINVVTLGCWKNVVDSEQLLAQLRQSSAPLVDTADEADTVVINTCGFIDAAKQESIDAIVEAVQRKSEGRLKKVVVMGCLSERYRTELAAELPEVDAFFGSNQIADVVQSLDIDYKNELVGERLLTTPSHFAYLKISEGCDHPCSFCAIPIMRGKHRTKPHDVVMEEARALARKGVRELIVIAQDSTYYGMDLYGERTLPALLDELCAIDGIEWVRLMYAYPAKFPLALLDVFQRNPKLCRYLDIPVQHASDDVLKSMRRGISHRALRELLHTIRAAVPGIALRTTLIVGYPNETERDFDVLCEFVREMKFHRLGVFTYSQEEGTAAFPLNDPIPHSVKEERKAVIMELQREIAEERNTALAGERIRVLIDRRENGHYVGRTEWDAPEIDQEVIVRSKELLEVGNFCDVAIVGTDGYDVYADAVRL
jgi:ribosomal protein S12 methylthiotransferase